MVVTRMYLDICMIINVTNKLNILLLIQVIMVPAKYESIQDCLNRIPTMNIIPNNIHIGRYTFATQHGWSQHSGQCVLSIIFTIKCISKPTQNTVYKLVKTKMKERGIIYSMYGGGNNENSFIITSHSTAITNTYIKLFSLLAPIEITINRLNMPTLLELCINELTKVDVLRILYDYHVCNGSDAMLSLMNVLDDNKIYTKMTKDL